MLGDIGPWACAGQTGGRVYMRVNEEWGLDREALERRLGKGAQVGLQELDAEGVADVQELLGLYAQELERSEQHEEARRIRGIARARRHFLMSVPEREQTDPPPPPTDARSGNVGDDAVGHHVVEAHRVIRARSCPWSRRSAP